ncbi:acyl-CoA thioesterase [Pseudonocardia nigra]|uniref:acyl-CoA thioesterase n=1 Tax=Pseudonocardia nigra TaxID=1921578 RepID=UPI001C601FAE|nr:thioesterase family protein [Pseudonocardia nigra]
MSDVVIHPVTVRYMEIDAQGVVFNGWYLTWFDEAMATFFTARGAPYHAMIEAGYDVQLVHSEIDWKAGVRWQDAIEVAVSTARVGRTSFALDFEVRRDGAEVTCAGRTVYVVIATDGSGKRPIPPLIAEALGEPAPLH